jgi:hypothetical protein
MTCCAPRARPLGGLCYACANVCTTELAERRKAQYLELSLGKELASPKRGYEK